MVLPDHNNEHSAYFSGCRKPVVGRFPYPDRNGSILPIAIGAMW
jgi:hypothetical protein